MSGEEEQVVTVEVDVKGEEDSPDASDAQAKPEAEGETPAAEPQQEPEEEEAAAAHDSGSDDEKEAAGKRLEKHTKAAVKKSLEIFVQYTLYKLLCRRFCDKCVIWL